MAWVGDCHAVMCKKERKITTVRLTQGANQEHTPLNPKERARIFTSRGEVKTGQFLSGDKQPRIYVRGRTFPGISTTRSLGDLVAHHIGVTSEPTVKIINLTKYQAERYLAIATDGVWDNLTPEEVTEQINGHGMHEMGAGTEYVVNKARDVAHVKKVPIDDTTILVSYLRRDEI
jgi:serine/threonine protein phosphatase PrpC